MLTLLAPAALFGLALLAIPVIVHLFKPRKMRVTPFSSLRWLRQTRQHLSRRIQWHQLLLFALRAAFIVLLVLALARPVFGPAGDDRPVERFVVLDVSRSMGYQPVGRPRPIDLGRQLAADLVTRRRADDRTAVLLTGSATRVLMAPTFDPQARLADLEAVEATGTETDLTSALAVLRPMLAHQRDGSALELYFLTDNPQRAWAQGEVAAFARSLPADARVRVVDVGIASAQNAWIAGARLLPTAEGAPRLLRVDVGSVGDTGQERTVTVGDRSEEVTTEPGRLTAVVLELPPGGEPPDRVLRVRLEPPDALASDDVYFLNLDTPAALRVLLVEPDGPATESLRPGFHLRTAVEALSAATNQAINLTTRTATAAKPSDFAAADVVFLAGVPELTDPALEALETRVKAGAGLVIFLGPNLKPEFYNTKLHRPLTPADGLLALPLKAVAEAPATLAPLTGVRWSHRVLAPLHDSKRGDLAQTRFRSFYRFAASPADGDHVLAWIDDDAPAIVERTLGAGKVVLFNTTANDEWSDLPRRNSYLPLVDRLLADLSGGSVRRSFEVGDPVALPLPDGRPGDTVKVQTPSGTTTATLAAAGNRPLFRLDAAPEAGVYRVEPSGKTFVVNAGRGDSVLAPADVDALKTWWSPAAFEVVGADAAGRTLAPEASPVPLWPWLLLLGGLLLVAETYLVHRLCPRVNPALAEVVVHRRGLLRPLRGGEG